MTAGSVQIPEHLGTERIVMPHARTIGASVMQSIGARRKAGLNCATLVLRNHLSFEEGLQAALESKAVDEFIESLNLLVGGHKYSIAHARQLIASGELQEILQQQQAGISTPPPPLTPEQVHEAQAVESEIGADDNPPPETTEEATEPSPEEAASQQIAVIENYQKQLHEAHKDLRDLQEMRKHLEMIAQEKPQIPLVWINAAMSGIVGSVITIVTYFMSWNIWVAMMLALGITVLAIIGLIRDREIDKRIQNSYLERQEHNRRMMESVTRQVAIFQDRVDFLKQRLIALGVTPTTEADAGDSNTNPSN